MRAVLTGWRYPKTLLSSVIIRMRADQEVTGRRAALARAGEERYGIYVQEGAVLNEQHRKAYIAARPYDAKTKTDAKLSPKDQAEENKVRQFFRCADLRRGDGYLD